MLACIVLAFSIGMVAGAGSGFTYPESPANGWTGTCETGMMQSPINLTHTGDARIHAPITYRNYFNGHFNKHHKGLLKGEGCGVSWFPNHKDTNKVMGGSNWKTHCPNIRDGPYAGLTHSHAYYLWQLHFHWGMVGDKDHGSEHTVEGKAYALELHLVHVEDQFIDADGTVRFGDAKKDKHGIAVLGIFFDVKDMKTQNMEPLEKIDDEVWEFHYHHDGHSKRAATEEEIEDAELDHYHNLNVRSLAYGFEQLSKARKEKRTPMGEEAEHKLKLNVGAFIRKAVRNGKDKTMSTYWTYQGSLTTPTCDEAVTWVVFERALPIAQVQSNAFASLCNNNYRMSRMAAPEHNVQYLIHKPIHMKPKKK